METHRPRKLWHQVRDARRLKDGSYRTERPPVDWVRRLMSFHHLRVPAEMSGPPVQAVLPANVDPFRNR